MKRVFIILTLMACLGMAQAQDVARYRVTYETEGQLRSNASTKRNLRFTLDIGQQKALFYNMFSRALVRETKALGPNASMADAYKIMDKYPNAKRYGLEILWNNPEKGEYTYLRDFSLTKLKYTDKLPDVEWQLCDSTRTIMEYACQMAVGTVEGRTWTVWYAQEIPFSYGPWLLGGLPGLILEAEDADHLFSFSAIGLEEVEGQEPLALLNEESAVKCTKKRFREVRKQSETDPVGFAATLTGFVSKGADANGKSINYAERNRGVTFHYLDKE